ncbi:hypothetical protein DSO57_1001569 [Entomophthora muscae]|uniref:Uncharacterized protein n=1 Tax=Entomophthora muscae TaxID=34485 RepID=A0ACC2SAR5_9FUNG|nr:hypothetical protein DSO57_1001569 [Entomophthora muscae]
MMTVYPIVTALTGFQVANLVPCLAKILLIFWGFTWTLEDLKWYTRLNAPKEPYQIVQDSKAITIYPLIFNRKSNNPAAYLVPMEPPLTPKPTISTPLF